jgi:phosphoglycerate kinase
MSAQGGRGEAGKDAVQFFGPGDAARLAAFERRFFPQPWTEDQFLASLGSGHFLCCGIERGGGLAAYLTATLAAGELEILNIAVQPEHRRQGLARRLLGHVLHLARETGMTDAFLEVRASNVPALALYACFGFKPQGRRRAYYPDNREDALVLRRTCGDPGGTERKNRQGAAMSMKFLDEMDISGKRILLRVDYNVPLDGGHITDDLRIRASLPTVRHALDKGASLVMCSHLGKAKGKPDPKFSLAPAAKRLSELIGRPVPLAPDCVGPEVEKMVAALAPGDVLMLENLRFHDGEEKNDPEFAKAMAAYGDIFVNDAFGTAHRPHASMVGFPKYAKAACAGFLLKREWEYLGKTMENPARPFVAVSGGAKVSSKLGVLKNLLAKVDRMVIGGAMANTFVAAQGFQVGASLVEPDLYDEAKNILALAKDRKVSVYLPVDFAVSMDAGKPLGDMKPAGVFPYQDIPAEGMILDIGPTTSRLFAQVLAPARTVLWNGPMGAFENPDFAEGSLSMARALADLDAVTVVGGGDTDVVVHKAGLADRMTFISTGGGASMEFLEGKELPAFKALKEC